jgi:hypothetical protein
MVNTTGSYTFTCSSGIDTYGYLYQESFDPSYTSMNLIVQDDDGTGTRDF